MEDILQYQQDQLRRAEELESTLRREIESAYLAGRTDAENDIIVKADADRQEDLARCEQKMRETEEKLLQIATERANSIQIDRPSEPEKCEQEYKQTLECYRSLKSSEGALGCAGLVQAFFSCSDENAKATAAKSTTRS